MEIWHHKLSKKYPAYRIWHEDPHHGHWHWFIFLVSALTVALSSLYFSYSLDYTEVITAQTSDITTGLVGHWKFDGDATDSSGQGNHGTIVGNPTFTQGQIGQAINLDGLDDYVDMGDPAVFPATSLATAVRG